MGMDDDEDARLPSEHLAELFAEDDWLGAEADALLHRLAEQRQPQPGAPLVYKTHQSPPPEPATHPVVSLVETLADEIGQTTGRMQREINELKAEVKALRDDLQIARAVNVADIRGRNVA